MRGGRRLPGAGRAAAARSRDDRAVRRAPPGRDGRAVRRGAGAVRAGRAGEGRGDRGRRDEAARPTRAATRTSITSRSRARSSKRPRPSTPPRTSSTARRAATSCPSSCAPARVGARGCAKPSSGSRPSAQQEARPVPRSRPKRLKEAKRRLEEELCTEVRANRAYEAYRARGRMKDGRRFGRPPEPYTPPATPGGPDQRHRPRLARRQGPARLHAGLQRPGRHQRAPDRHRRRGR